MRLYEILRPSFYMMCHIKQADNSLAKLDDEHYPLGEALEALLEKKRPEGRAKRTTSLYLRERPDGSIRYSYLVEPIGDVDRNHTGWLKMLVEADPSQEGVQAHWASGYWSGELCRDARREPWEYRTSQVRIIKRIGRSGYTTEVVDFSAAMKTRADRRPC